MVPPLSLALVQDHGVVARDLSLKINQSEFPNPHSSSDAPLWFTFSLDEQRSGAYSNATLSPTSTSVSFSCNQFTFSRGWQQGFSC